MTTAIGTGAAIGVPVAVVGTLGYVFSGWQVADLPPLALGFVYGPALAGHRRRQHAHGAAGVRAPRTACRWRRCAASSPACCTCWRRRWRGLIFEPAVFGATVVRSRSRSAAMTTPGDPGLRLPIKLDSHLQRRVRAGAARRRRRAMPARWRRRRVDDGARRLGQSRRALPRLAARRGGDACARSTAPSPPPAGRAAATRCRTRRRSSSPRRRRGARRRRVHLRRAAASREPAGRLAPARRARTRSATCPRAAAARPTTSSACPAARC